MPADTSDSSVRIVKETTFGIFPPAEDIQDTRFTGESLKYAKEFEESKEIRADGNVSSLIPTFSEIVGGLNIEMSYGTYDELMAAALRVASASWTAVSDVASDVAAAVTVNTFTYGTSLPTDLVEGQWMEIAGFTLAANNGYHLVTDITGLVVTVSTTLATEAAGDSITTTGSHIVNGTSLSSFSIEKVFTDLTKYMSFSGCTVDTFKLMIEARKVITGEFTFLGKSHVTAGASATSGAVLAATTTELYNSGDSIGIITENGVAIGTVRQISLDTTSSLRGRPAVGSQTHQSIGKGKFRLKGSLIAYFEDFDLYDKMATGTPTSIDFSMLDSASGDYLVTIPKAKLTGGDILAGGEDQDAMVRLDYQAYLHPTYGFTMGVSRFPV